MSPDDERFLSKLKPGRVRRADRARLLDMMAAAEREDGNDETADRLQADAATVRAGGTLATVRRWDAAASGCSRRLTSRYAPHMPHPTRQHILEIIELPEGKPSPPGALWINLSPVIGGSWFLDGNIPVPPGMMSQYGDYQRPGQALQAAIDFALGQQVPLIYVEIDARRCD